jgi:hypothetical protein
VGLTIKNRENMTFERYRFYERHQLPLHSDELELVGERALLVVRRDRVRFTDWSTCVWPSCSPRVVERHGPIDVFIEREGKYQYLGEASVAQYGRQRGASAPDARLHFRAQLSREQWLELQPPLPPLPSSPAEREIMALQASSTARHRISALRTFADSWFGARESSTSTPPPLIPAPLAELYRLVAANPSMIVQNRLVPADQVAAGGDKCVFYVENQGVCVWAYDARGDDPAVWFRTNDDRAAWQREREPLSGFVIQLVLFETIIAGPTGYGGSAAWLDQQQSDRLRDRFAPLPLGPWCWGPSSFHARDSALLFLMANGDDAYTAMVAAPHPHALSFIVDLIDDSWESVAF